MVFNSLDKINWKQHAARHSTASIPLLLYKLTSSVELWRKQANSDLITELDDAYKEEKDLGIVMVPILLEMLTHPEITEKWVISDILVYLTSYAHNTLTEPWKSHAQRIKDAVCEHADVYRQLIEKGEVVEDMVELLEICAE